MNRKQAIAVGAILISAGLAGCQSTANVLGLQPVMPDEFRIISKAPLVVPPDYGLRPPMMGEPRPQELRPTEAARAAVVGEASRAQRSEGENLLASKAGADKADPLIRYVVDDEYGDLAYKNQDFVDKVLFWRPEQIVAQTPSGPIAADPGATTPAPVDPTTEERRLANLTGGGKIVIQREYTPRQKLPGL